MLFRLGMWALLSELRQSMYRRALVQRLLVGMVITMTLIIIAALFATSLIVALLYFLYQIMVTQGLIPLTALAATGILAALALALLITLVNSQTRRLRDGLRRGSDITGWTKGILDSFLDGLLESPGRR